VFGVLGCCVVYFVECESCVEEVCELRVIGAMFGVVVVIGVLLFFYDVVMY